MPSRPCPMQPLTVPDIAARRLHAQRLIGEPFTSVVDTVRWLGAVQAQDYAGAIWALGQRTQGATVVLPPAGGNSRSMPAWSRAPAPPSVPRSPAAVT